ncbi:ABC transporter G family member 27 [Halotydeus destructor]|nr:ABC transporter G family member 27 [Halotydeus destructor]
MNHTAQEREAESPSAVEQLHQVRSQRSSSVDCSSAMSVPLQVSAHQREGQSDRHEVPLGHQLAERADAGAHCLAMSGHGCAPVPPRASSRHHVHNNQHNHHDHHHSHHRPLEVVFRNISLSIQLEKSTSCSSSSSSTCKTLSKLCPMKNKVFSVRRHNSSVLPETVATMTNGSHGKCHTPLTTCKGQQGQKVTSTPVSHNAKPVLRDVSGFARPGQMLGIMGPSGSGKTTLLSALSGRLRPTGGVITLNGETLNKQLRRKICYVLQQDIFFPDLTLRQTLTYTALLRLPDSMAYGQKMELIDTIIDVLDLGHCQHTIIGDMMKRGLSGGEKKRASIACELLTNPTVMLIDEPTSGLDSSTAHNLMQTLKSFAVKERKTVIATVHQPSSQIFHMFDKLLLLANGRVAFFGNVDEVVPFFSKIGHQISAHYNPADFIMEKVKGSHEDQEKIIASAKALVKTPSRRSSARPSPNAVIICEEQEDVTKEQEHDEQQHVEISCSYKNSHTAGSSANIDQQRHEHDHNEHPGGHGNQAVSSQESSECNTLWSGFKHDAVDHEGHHQLATEKEIRVIIDPSDKVQKVYSRIVCDDDSGRSSWTETDRSSTGTFSTTSSSVMSSRDMELDFTSNAKRKSNQKWPTSFWTQVSVLTQRNFYEARGRMLSTLNWTQTVGLALISGLIWMNVSRTEESLKDIRGWMFWSMTYWMLHALFSAMITFPPEREVINKERASGAYRLSAYYVAKMVGELPLTIALPTIFHCISYPLMGCSNITTFLLLWYFLILSIIVAQSVGLFIGAVCLDLEVSVTMAAIYSLSSMLFGGFYATTIPGWLSWMRYLSMVFYSFQNMQAVEFEYGNPILCSDVNSKYASCQNLDWHKDSPPEIPFEELRAKFDVMSSTSEPLPVWFNTLVLISYLVAFRIAGYVVLRYIRKPK